jgi:arginyl-tRNA synthetase
MPTPGTPHADIARELGARMVSAVAETLGLQITIEQAVIREAAGGHGCDYQSNAAMALAKRAGIPSRELAGQLVAALAVEELCEPPSVAGPGFINLSLRVEWLQRRLGATLADSRLGVPVSERPRRVVVDYSAPNVAKEMHVGHLRSTILGDAVARLLRFVGHDVIPQNHIGDWGTPFGMLIEHMLDEGWEEQSGEHSIGDLGDFYKSARTKFDASPEFAERARQRVVALQGGDAATLELWRDLVGESERHFEEIYDLLGVLLGQGDIAGESTYGKSLAGVAEELVAKQLAVVSDGALCVFPAGFKGRDGEPMPLIVRKRDGGYGYDTTDLAALRHRVLDLGAEEIVYVVGAPQRLHFEMVFAVAREAGWVESEEQTHHVAFGSVLGEDGKMLRTREGAPVRLVDLLHEAQEHATQVLAERGVELQDSPDLARSIGIGAVKYADLSGDREKDYVFSFGRMLSLEGNTSVYLQYANARACSVLRRAEEPNPAPGRAEEPDLTGDLAAACGSDQGEGPRADGAEFVLLEPAERELALTLLRLPAAIESVLVDYKPHKLCTYLHGVAVAYSGFYEACPILTAEDPGVRASRLALCELTSRVLTLGLGQLGIDAPQRLSSPPPRA